MNDGGVFGVGLALVAPSFEAPRLAAALILVESLVFLPLSLVLGQPDDQLLLLLDAHVEVFEFASQVVQIAAPLRFDGSANFEKGIERCFANGARQAHA